MYLFICMYASTNVHKTIKQTNKQTNNYLKLRSYFGNDPKESIILIRKPTDINMVMVLQNYFVCNTPPPIQLFEVFKEMDELPISSKRTK